MRTLPPRFAAARVARAPRHTHAARLAHAARVTALLTALLAAASAHAGPRRKIAPAAACDTAAAALRQGRYEDALAGLGQPVREPPLRSCAARLAARAEVALGRLAEARRRLETAVAAAPDDLPLRAELLAVLDEMGDRAAAKPLIDRAYDDWQGGRVDKSDARQLLAVADAVRRDDENDDAYADANDVMRRAAEIAGRSADVELAWGRMFLDTYATGEAEVAFTRALEADPGNADAHAGLARVKLNQGYDAPAAEQEIARALDTNPRHAGALALRGEMALDAEDWDGVAAVAAQLRRTNPADPGAAWLAAARALLLDDRATWEQERAARLIAHPNDGAFFAAVAEALVRQRRYDDARAVAEEGVRLEPRHARGLAVLGQVLLWAGREAEGVEMLRRAFKLDPYNVKANNTLDLFEKVIPRAYETVKTKHLVFRVEPKTRAAIEAVVGPYLDGVYERYVARYGFEPEGPVTLELYGDPQYYAARTVGTSRLGLAGVCFGRVITSQAPTNHVFNWGMVLAHELAHVFSIQLSRTRVPRWFTEGLAEVETMHLRPEWQRHMDAELWGGLRAGALPPLSDLSRSFLRARGADEAQLAYTFSALAVDFLERRFGFAKLREALAAWGRGERGPAVLERLAGMPAAALDAALRADLAGRLTRFDAQWVPTQTLRAPREEAERRAAAAPGDATLAAVAGLAQLAAGDRRAAQATLAGLRAHLAGAERDVPAVAFLAGELALSAMDAPGAVQHMRALVGLGHDGHDVRVRLALAQIHMKDLPGAEDSLRRAIAFDATRVETHALLGEVLADEHKPDARLDELEAALRLEPQSAKVAKEIVLAQSRAGRVTRVLALAPVALFVDPADADVHAAYGRALLATGKTREGAEALERALLFAPAQPEDIHRTLAEAWTKLGDLKRAAGHRTPALRP